MIRILSVFFVTLLLTSLATAVFAADPIKNNKSNKVSAANDAASVKEKRAKQIKERNKKAKENLKINGPYVSNELETPKK